MKKVYIKPEIEEVAMAMRLLQPVSQMDFKEKPDSQEEEEEDDEVDDFNQLLKKSGSRNIAFKHFGCKDKTFAGRHRPSDRPNK